MTKGNLPVCVRIENVEEKIFWIRGQKVMLNLHLAELYGVEAKVLTQAVKRNINRFPPDFMFQLTWPETKFLRSHFVTLEKLRKSRGRSEVWLAGRGHYSKYRLYAFTEQGVAMLSGVLNSHRAVQVNVAIMRAFVRLRGVLAAHKELAAKLVELERKVEKHDGEIHAIFNAIRKLMKSPPPEKPQRRIGFHP